MNIREADQGKQEGAEANEPQSASALVRVGTSSEYRENQMEFCCSNCQLFVKCRFGKLQFEKVGLREECYYMRDPFEPPNYHKAQKDYSLEDFLVVGSKCFICEQQICVDEECSLFYKNTYCLKCVWRERHSFPDELVQQVYKQKQKAKDAEATKT